MVDVTQKLFLNKSLLSGTTSIQIFITGDRDGVNVSFNGRISLSSSLEEPIASPSNQGFNHGYANKQHSTFIRGGRGH